MSRNLVFVGMLEWIYKVSLEYLPEDSPFLMRRHRAHISQPNHYECTVGMKFWDNQWVVWEGILPDSTAALYNPRHSAMQHDGLLTDVEKMVWKGYRWACWTSKNFSGTKISIWRHYCSRVQVRAHWLDWFTVRSFQITFSKKTKEEKSLAS